jgi:hypothetical protein
MIKKGRSDGTITVYQRESADFVEASISLGNIIQKMAIKKIIKEKIILEIGFTTL